MIGGVCSRLSSDINAFNLKRISKISIALCRDGSIYMGG